MRKVLNFIFRAKEHPHYEELRRNGVDDALQVSLIVVPATAVAMGVFLIMSFIWPESYGTDEFLFLYRGYYFMILLGLVLYEGFLFLTKKAPDMRYRVLPVLNVVLLFMLLLWTLRMTAFDSISFGRVDATLYMIVTICVPFCLYLDVRVYLFFMCIADAIMVALFLKDGMEAAFNVANLGDFFVFIGVHLILGVAIFYYKYAMRERILNQRFQQEEIRQLNEAQNRFFSNMSHEIRTPINTIIGLNEMILRQNASEEINEDARNIQGASKMLLHLINDILDMSKFESGQMELNMAPYHTGDMLSDIVGMLWIRAKEKNLEFHVDVSPDLPSELVGDEMRIKQVLINVINNAIKYTAEGSVRLTIQCERDGEGTAIVSYSVSDTGMGIKKESIPHLFTAFKRVDEDKNKYIEGTGLGLSIVKQFIDLMGGKITVNSIYTKGSTFIIEIPQKIENDDPLGEIDVENHHRAKETRLYVESFEAPEAKVLVVDDTAANLLVVSKLLKETKVQITTATSGEEALKRTLEDTYHVILMDHKMPGMDGIECMHAVREQVGGLCQEAKIIALTANAGSDTEIMYEREGFDGYLMKPVTGEDLENMVCNCLPRDIVTVTGSTRDLAEESKAWVRKHKKKANIKVTTESMADLPKSLLDRYNIAVIPHLVRTDDGLFKDGLEIETNGLLSYMEKSDVSIETLSPSVEEHDSFFSEQLDDANNILHVSISSKVHHDGSPEAFEAAEYFGNVSVIDSGHLSSGMGLMAIEAARLVEQGLTTEEILPKLEVMKNNIHTSFIVASLDYLVRQKQVGKRTGHLGNAFMVHPVLALKNGVMKVARVYFGSTERVWDKYIAAAFRVPGKIDKRMLFITYVGMSNKDLESVKKKALKKVAFEEVYIQKASPTIAANSGPGTFGLLFFTEY
ncbi:MAG: DegV family EDD domain-containing protein [Lachnospiraceae bacterium]|nr:DegV family EDD domain-containing protein [Lachnospiraceae bacterium]